MPATKHMQRRQGYTERWDGGGGATCVIASVLLSAGRNPWHFLSSAGRTERGVVYVLVRGKHGKARAPLKYAQSRRGATTTTRTTLRFFNNKNNDKSHRPIASSRMLVSLETPGTLSKGATATGESETSPIRSRNGVRAQQHRQTTDAFLRV